MRRLWIALGAVAVLGSCDAVIDDSNLESVSEPDLAASAIRSAWTGGPTLSPEEIHSVHAPWGIPAGSPPSNDLIFRHSYTASTNDETRFADWVAYMVTPEWMEDLSDPDRDYCTDPVLDDAETLEERSGRGDYDDAHAEHGYDRGHLVPLGSFHGSPFVQEVNYLSVLAPQIDRLNRGPWRSLENRVRRLVDATGTVYVLVGTCYDERDPMPELPGSDEPHTVPTAFWMIVYTAWESAVATGGAPGGPGAAGDSPVGEAPGDVNAGPSLCAFLVPQRLPTYDGPEDFITSVDEIEAMTGLDMLSLLEDEVEDAVEAATREEWFGTW